MTDNIYIVGSSEIGKTLAFLKLNNRNVTLVRGRIFDKSNVVGEIQLVLAKAD